MSDLQTGPIIFVDADACPVKDEVYKVAWRHGVPVRVVSNQRLRVPEHALIERVTVSDAFDAADDWIAERSRPGAVVVTGDILLADRCLKAGAAAIAPNGRPFTRGLDRRRGRDAGDHGRSARGHGRARRRAAAVRQGGPLALPAGAGRGAGSGEAELGAARRGGGEAPDSGRLRI